MYKMMKNVHVELFKNHKNDLVMSLFYPSNDTI